MALRYRHFRRIYRTLPQSFPGVRCEECRQAAGSFIKTLIPLALHWRKIGSSDVGRGFYASRFSTVAEISQESTQDVDLISFINSSFGQSEGPYHCWLNTSQESKEFFRKDRTFLILADAFGPKCDSSNMLEKVKSLQQRYPWLHVFCFQSSTSTRSNIDQCHLLHDIMEKYITFPILLSSKIFTEVENGPYCILFKGFKNPSMYNEMDVNLGILEKAIKDLNVQCDKNSGIVHKLRSTWSKQIEVIKEPSICSSLQNLLLYYPAGIAVDGSGHRLFVSDSNHHRVVVFDGSGKILDLIGSSPGFEDGDFETARLKRPTASFYDSSEDCLYLVDSENHAIRRADMQRRVLETVYPTVNDEGNTGLWTWIWRKLGFEKDNDTMPKEHDPDSLMFPWHLLKSKDGDFLVLNRRFDTLWIMDLNTGLINDVVRGSEKILEVCREEILERVSCLNILPQDWVQRLVTSSHSLDEIPYASLMSSFVTFGDHLIKCDAVGARILKLNMKDKVVSSFQFSNFGALGLPYWLQCSVERVYVIGGVYGEANVDMVQSFSFLPGRIDIHLSVDIPCDAELVEPLDERCIWRQTRGAALEVSGMETKEASVEKVGVAQQWYDELDNLAFTSETNDSTEERSVSDLNIEDDTIHIHCAVNTSPGTSEVIVCAPLYLKLKNDSITKNDNQEKKAAAIANILKLEKTGLRERDAFIKVLLSNSNHDLGELVFIKPLQVRVRLNTLNHPKADNSRDIILTDSTIDVKVPLN